MKIAVLSGAYSCVGGSIYGAEILYTIDLRKMRIISRTYAM